MRLGRSSSDVLASPPPSPGAFPRNAVLEFRLDPAIPKVAAFFLAMGGSTLLACAVLFEDQGVPAALGVLGIVLLAASPAALTFHKVVRIDKKTGSVERSLHTLGRTRTDQLSLSNLTGVGIGMGGDAGTYSRSAVYFVQLIGSTTNVSLPGTSNDREAVVALGRNVAEHLGLPFDDRPRMAAFGWRL